MIQRQRSPSSTDRWTYDVFLSFRGCDTRHGFTGNLYNALCERGIHTFIDDEEVRRGEEITPALLKAIEQSRIAIVVFSKNYANSAYCLEELVKTLERTKETGRLVWPVFYGVNPCDVRCQKGSYGEALAELEEKSKISREKVSKWKLALQEAANLAGWHFKHGYEYEFIGKIVEEVSRKVNNHAYVSGGAVVHCSGTDSSFNNYAHGSQIFKDANINSGGLNLKEGNAPRASVRIVSGEIKKLLNKPCSGTEASFNCHGNGSQNFKDAIINSGENSGNVGGSGSAVAESGQQHGVSGTRDSFNNYGSSNSSNSQDFTGAKINSGENSGGKKLSFDSCSHFHPLLLAVLVWFVFQFSNLSF